MYVPKLFEITDWTEISRFIRTNPLGTLVSRGDQAPVATHVPFQLETNKGDKSVLTGHVARGNPQCGLFESQPDVLVIFLSPIQHYVSSSWYGHPNVPTWNYMSVHIYGRLQIVEGERLRKSLEETTLHHDQISSHPLTDEVLRGEIDKQIGGIVGFEIEIERVEAAYKMSQNRSDKDYASIITELEKLNDYSAKMVAEKMKGKGK